MASFACDRVAATAALLMLLACQLNMAQESDIDRCAKGQHNCTGGYGCHNIVGSFMCLLMEHQANARIRGTRLILKKEANGTLNPTSPDEALALCGGDILGYSHRIAVMPILKKFQNSINSLPDKARTPVRFWVNYRGNLKVFNPLDHMIERELVTAYPLCAKHSPGSNLCSSSPCPRGYECKHDAFNYTCNIDECAKGQHNCTGGYRCHNLIGSSMCLLMEHQADGGISSTRLILKKEANGALNPTSSTEAIRLCGGDLLWSTYRHAVTPILKRFRNSILSVPAKAGTPVLFWVRLYDWYQPFNPLNGRTETGSAFAYPLCAKHRPDYTCDLKYDRFCYKLFRTRRTFADAENTCNRIGGSLARIFTPTLNSQLRGLVPKRWWYWIGLRKTQFRTEKKYRQTFRTHELQWTIGDLATNSGRLPASLIISFGTRLIGSSLKRVTPRNAFESFAGYRVGSGAEPNGDNDERCICSQSDGWHDRACSKPLAFVCQRDQDGL